MIHAHISLFLIVQCSCSLVGEGTVLAASPAKDFIAQIKLIKVEPFGQYYTDMLEAVLNYKYVSLLWIQVSRTFVFAGL